LSKLFCQDQDQDQDFIFCPRGASRPRLWSRGLHHWHPQYRLSCQYVF